MLLNLNHLCHPLLVAMYNLLIGWPLNVPLCSDATDECVISSVAIAHCFSADCNPPHFGSCIQDRQVYDSELEAQLVMLYDTNKKLLLVLDEYVKNVTLKKGDYLFKMQIRHEKLDLLEKLKDMPLVLEMQLEKSVPVPIYTNLRESLKRGSQVSSHELYVGEKMTMVVGPVAEDLPKECTAGISWLSSGFSSLLLGWIGCFSAGAVCNEDCIVWHPSGQLNDVE